MLSNHDKINERELLVENHDESGKKLPSCYVAGLKVSVAGREELVRKAIADCSIFNMELRTSSPRLVFDANGQAISLYSRNREYKEALDGADIIHADGAFVVFSSWLFSDTKIKERTATTDMIHDFASAAQLHGLTFYLLGGTQESIGGCVRELKSQYPELNIVGYRNGYFSDAQEDEVIREINRASPDILWVGLGKPKEQIFSFRNSSKIRAGWLVTCGGCFDFLSGRSKRAPMWMQVAGIEWLFRLSQDPKRLFWRYLYTNPHAIYLTLLRAWQNKERLNRREAHESQP